MQLTQHTDFGLRLLIVLARSETGSIALPAFAADQGLSYNHVAKVAQGLIRGGFITSQRGRNGGVTLARVPAELTVGEVVRALEPGMRLADCGRCALRFDCATSGVLSEALAAFIAVLDRTTLAEAARRVPTAFAAAAPGSPEIIGGA